MIHGLLEFALGPPPRTRSNANVGKPLLVIQPLDEIQGP